MTSNGLVVISSILVTAVHTLGVLTAAHAVMQVRSSQGAIAWGMSLITFPWLALPLYWVFGRNHFLGYQEAMRRVYIQHHERIHEIYRQLKTHQVSLPEPLTSLDQLARLFTPLTFTAGNTVTLLIDGQQTYAAMLGAIAQAQHYILLQSYIINDDETGRDFQQALIARAQQGVRICLLYDEIGSKNISRSYIQALRQQGIQVSAFHTTKGRGNRLQINFRNHRKILVVDGETAFVGGLNIGNEYLGKDPKLSPWRDTHIQISGPSVQALQSSFLGDWYWATGELPEVFWQVQRDFGGHATALILPTGPADPFPTCQLFLINAINLAHSRLWIASPYFVPDEPVLAALKLAVMRGVDVRILLPNRPDHLFVYLCSFAYYTELQSVGIQLYRYKQGFMHQKIMLIDQAIAGVGTVNLDNRSFFLNFEVMGFITEADLIQSIETMLQADLTASIKVNLDEYCRQPFWFRLVVKTARLLSPIL
ncbi:cardiolipin synthase [Pantanalinema rosaneae CENA516]|uniref:cardiolipin synthase n=1 Tax=Pantanalinema rosaneae TaxID=1620701 RepID=UPI003D6F419C